MKHQATKQAAAKVAHQHHFFTFSSLWKIVLLYLVAWAISRLAKQVAERFLRWHDKQTYDPDSTLVTLNLKRRETLVGITRATVAFVAFAAATIYTVSQATGGFSRFTTIAGAGLLVAVFGFTSTRVLSDMIAGLSMFIERWFAVGDMVIVQPHDLQGVVENVTLRATTLRAVNGERIHINNGQIAAVRVLPRGVKELAVEIFVADPNEGQKLVEQAIAILPQSPTSFPKPPQIKEVEEAGKLSRISILCSVTPGREWMVEEWFCDLLREQGGEGGIVHGPVVMAVSEKATQAFARARFAHRKATG